MTGADPPVGSATDRRTLSDRVALGIATGGGAGYVPRAPGTMGALVGAVLYVTMTVSGLDGPYFALLGVLTVTGTWAATRVEDIYGHDASRIVIDEVVGQMLTLAFVTRPDAVALARGVILGFLLFRFFDILKPFPIRQLERLPGGLGVMADDVGAGLYAFLALLFLEPLATSMAGAL